MCGIPISNLINPHVTCRCCSFIPTQHVPCHYNFEPKYEICLVVIIFNSDMGDLVPITMTLDNNIRTLFYSMHVILGECITQEKQGMNYINKARRKMEDKPR